jgi:hypothetical protein
VFGLTKDDTDEILTELDNLTAADKKAQYENYLAVVVSAINMPDVSKILAGSYVDLQLTKKGDAFVWKYDVLINANFDGTAIAGMGVDFGSNSFHLTINENTKAISPFELDPPEDFIDAADTQYFWQLSEAFNPAGIDPYSDYGYGWD